MISKGTHVNLSIRDMLAQQNIEEKRQHQFGGLAKKRLPAPGKLTQANFLHLLYEQPSLTDSAPSQRGAPYASGQASSAEMEHQRGDSGYEHLDVASHPQHLLPANDQEVNPFTNQQILLEGEEYLPVVETPAILYSHAAPIAEHAEATKNTSQVSKDYDPNAFSHQFHLRDGQYKESIVTGNASVSPHVIVNPKLC